MRVLFLSGEFPPQQGGVGDYTKQLVLSLANCGIDARVLTARPSAAPDSTDNHDPEVLRLVKNWNWAAVRLAKRVIQDLGPQIVHIQYQTAAFGMHPAINTLPRILSSDRFSNFIGPSHPRLARPADSSSSRPRFVTTFHDLKLPYLFPKAGFVREKVTFELAHSSAAVVATNQEDWDRLSKQVSEKLWLIPIGSNIPMEPPKNYDRQAWRAHLGVAPDEVLLTYFGFLNDSKGGENLMRAAARLPKAHVLMVGGQVGSSDPTNAAYLDRVKRLQSGLGLESRVLWTGFIASPDVTANLLASDVCVLPYRDGASFRRGSFMAALAHGLPIVTTKPQRGEQTGPQGLPELKDGDNVILVTPEDPDALAQAITRLADDKALREKLGRGALELAAFFSWDRIASQHVELYFRLVGKGFTVA